MIAVRPTNHHAGAMEGAGVVSSSVSKSSSSSFPSFCKSDSSINPQDAATTSKEAQRAMTITGRPYLSWSQITSYSLCPKAFEFRYVIKESPDFVPSSLAFGTAFHEAVALITQADLEGAVRPSTGSLVAVVHQHLSGGPTPIQFGKGESLDSLLALASRMLDAYAASPESMPPGATLSIEDVARGVLAPDIPPIEARVDHVYRRADGSIVVRDIKTTRTKWSESKVAEAAPQLRLYAKLLDADYRADGGVNQLQFVTITKAAKPVVACHQVPHDGVASNDGLTEIFSATWHGITSGVFPARPGWPCKSCPYASRCSAAIGIVAGAPRAQPE